MNRKMRTNAANAAAKQTKRARERRSEVPRCDDCGEPLVRGRFVPVTTVTLERIPDKKRMH